MNNLLNKIEQMRSEIGKADCILIGAGAGLSTAAGVEYIGTRFTQNLSKFIEKYHFTDMYTAGFYEFKTEEEKWAYWAKHIFMNCTGMEATSLYQKLLEIIKGKAYFVITTNVDEQFYKAGFDKNRIFAPQGSYRFLQCKKGCHDKLYDNTNLVKKMIASTDENLKIPTSLVPKCPICGGNMEVNIRKNAFFVQDENWYQQSNQYEDFLEYAKGKKLVLLELGVGFNTPMIIRIPFEQMASENENWKLIRINQENASTFLDIEGKSLLVEADISEVITKYGENL